MQFDPRRQSEVRDALVVSQAKPSQPDVVTACMSAVSQLVPQAHPPQLACPQTAPLEENVAMQTDPVVRSQIHGSAVVSQAQPPQPDALTGCLSAVSQLVPEAHSPQPVCPQTPGNWRHPVSERSVSEGSVLDIVGLHPVAHPLSEPVQSPDAWRDHIPVPPAAVVPRPNNDDWWWSNDWNRPHHKHHQAPNLGVLDRRARPARFRGYKVARAPNCGVSDRWAGDH